MTQAEHLLAELVTALDRAFISTWQSTAAWQKELDAARDYLNICTCKADQMTFGRCCRAGSMEVKDDCLSDHHQRHRDP